MERKPVNVRLEKELWEAVNEIARQEGVTLSDIIRRAIRLYLGYVTLIPASVIRVDPEGRIVTSTQPPS